MEIIRKNIEIIKNNIINFANNDEIEFVAVTKTFNKEIVLEVLKCGIKHIGENRIQEALPKFEQLGSDLNGIKKHFIGHLQSNKVKKVVKNFDLIQSLDTIKLANTINNYAKKINKLQDCLIEIKVSPKILRTGVELYEINDFYEKCLSISNIVIRGLMVIAPYSNDFKDSRYYFRLVYKLFKNIKKIYNNSKFSILSMGMSNDYMIAIEEGANMIRIGSAIYSTQGKRFDVINKNAY
ncbi:MAG: YggS family pyridoxal phosphate-dependent enzyme [Endomicrobium sp.]|jgi:pyridoxal phosphate enzyme (YggS family)|nr:YggS family pyridoxal phosphate-dependent enzyme [Endomicrobium sp.]